MKRLALQLISLVALGCGSPEVADSGPEPSDAGVLVDAGSPVDAGPPLPDPPATLSETGLFASGVTGPYADGVQSYDVRYRLWTDGAEKRRHLLLPPGTAIDTSDPDNWAFPEGTRLFKEFLVDGVPVETRLLWKTGPSVSDWVYVAYRYREDGSDAYVVPDGASDARGTMHDVPSTSDCRNCHRGAGDFVLGVGAIQLDRASYDSWTASGLLPAGTAWQEPPGDETQRQALGYLHGNCGHCHSDTHPLAMQRGLRLWLPVDVTDPYLAPAWVTSVNAEASHEIGGARTIVVAGDPSASQLYLRMGLRDGLGMPPVGTEVVHEDARALIAAWITGDAP